MTFCFVFSGLPWKNSQLFNSTFASVKVYGYLYGFRVMCIHCRFIRFKPFVNWRLLFRFKVLFSIDEWFFFENEIVLVKIRECEVLIFHSLIVPLPGLFYLCVWRRCHSSLFVSITSGNFPVSVGGSGLYRTNLIVSPN